MARMPEMDPARPSFAEALGNKLKGIRQPVSATNTSHLESVVIGRILPFIGLHATAIGACSWAFQSPETFFLNGTWMAVPTLLFGLIAWRATLAGKGEVPMVNAAVCALFTLIALPDTVATLLGILFLFGLLVASVGMRRIPPRAVAVPCIYLPIALLAVLPHWNLIRFAVELTVYLATVIVVVRRWGVSHIFPLLIAATILIVTEHNSSMVVPIVIIGLFLIGFIVYEVKAKMGSVSSLRRFLGQGLVALVLLVFAAIVDPDGKVILPAPMMTCVLIVGYHLIMVIGTRFRDSAPRLLWISIALLFLVWQRVHVGEQLGRDFWLLSGLSLGLVAALTLLFRHRQDRFGLQGAQVFGLLAVSRPGYLVHEFHDDTRFVIDSDVVANSGTCAGILIVVTACYLIVAATVTPAVTLPQPSWWRGLLMPRHAVVIRRSLRGLLRIGGRLPVVGALFQIFGSLKSFWSEVTGRSKGFRQEDLTLISISVGSAWMAEMVVESYLWQHWPAVFGERNDTQLQLLATAASWSSWSVLAYLRGYLTREPLSRFLAVGFTLVPLVNALRSVWDDAGLATSIAMLGAGIPLMIYGLIGTSRPKSSG